MNLLSTILRSCFANPLTPTALACLPVVLINCWISVFNALYSFFTCQKYKYVNKQGELPCKVMSFRLPSTHGRIQVHQAFVCGRFYLVPACQSWTYCWESRIFFCKGVHVCAIGCLCYTVHTVLHRKMNKVYS